MESYKAKNCLIIVLVIIVLTVTGSISGNQVISSGSPYEIFLADNNHISSSQAPTTMHERHRFVMNDFDTNPLWNNDSFVSTNRTGTTSDFRLLDNITQFHYSYLSNYQRVCDNNCFTDINVAFRQTLHQGFHQDSYLHAKPFNATFIGEILQNVYFCFATMPGNHQGTGFYRSAPNRSFSRIWANTDRKYLCFAHTIIHEMGHALGLGETLADLKAESFIGHTSSSRKSSNLAYNSTFDRMLLSAVGRNRFWAAAYHSNAAYGELWDGVFGDIITHNELEIVRGVVLVSTADNRLRSVFESSGSFTLEQASERIHDYFVNLNDDNLSSVQRQDTFDHLREWIDFYVSFSIQNALCVSPSVHDWIIDNHHIRFN